MVFLGVHFGHKLQFRGPFGLHFLMFLGYLGPLEISLKRWRGYDFHTLEVLFAGTNSKLDREGDFSRMFPIFYTFGTPFGDCFGIKKWKKLVWKNNRTNDRFCGPRGPWQQKQMPKVTGWCPPPSPHTPAEPPRRTPGAESLLNTVNSTSTLLKLCVESLLRLWFVLTRRIGGYIYIYIYQYIYIYIYWERWRDTAAPRCFTCVWEVPATCLDLWSSMQENTSGYLPKSYVMFGFLVRFAIIFDLF